MVFGGGQTYKEEEMMRHPRGQIVARLRCHAEGIQELALAVLAGIVELEPGTTPWRVIHHNKGANSYSIRHEDGREFHFRGARKHAVSGPYTHIVVGDSYNRTGTRIAILRTRGEVNRFFDDLHATTWKETA